MKKKDHKCAWDGEVYCGFCYDDLKAKVERLQQESKGLRRLLRELFLCKTGQEVNEVWAEAVFGMAKLAVGESSEQEEGRLDHKTNGDACYCNPTVEDYRVNPKDAKV